MLLKHDPEFFFGGGGCLLMLLMLRTVNLSPSASLGEHPFGLSAEP